MYEEMFGLGFLALLGVSILYAVGRTIYERWIKVPPTEEGPAVIPFHGAVRLACKVAKDRVIAEAVTMVLVLPRQEDGSVAPPEPSNPGSLTVDVQTRVAGGAHRRQRYIGHAAVIPRVPEAA